MIHISEVWDFHELLSHVSLQNSLVISRKKWLLNICIKFWIWFYGIFEGNIPFQTDTEILFTMLHLRVTFVERYSIEYLNHDEDHRKFECIICAKKFTKKYSLNQHNDVSSWRKQRSSMRNLWKNIFTEKFIEETCGISSPKSEDQLWPM